MMDRFPGYLLCHPRTVERIVSGTLRSVLPPLRSVRESSLGNPADAPAYLLCPRQEGERKNHYPVAVLALPVVLPTAVAGSRDPIYDVLDSTRMGLQKKIEKMVGLTPL